MVFKIKGDKKPKQHQGQKCRIQAQVNSPQSVFESMMLWCSGVFNVSPIRWCFREWLACVRTTAAALSECWRNSGRLSWRRVSTAPSLETRTSTSTFCSPSPTSSTSAAATWSWPPSPRRTTGTELGLSFHILHSNFRCASCSLISGTLTM